MAIFRKHKSTNFTTIDNNIFKNQNLSNKATGLLCLMLSLPDDWDFSIEGLMKLKKDNRSAIRTALFELEEEGYLHRERDRNEKGILTNTIYDIYEVPMLENQTLDEPKFEKPTLEKPTLENRTQLNTNNIKDLNKSNKEIYKERFEVFYKAYPKHLKKAEVEKWFLKNKPDETLFKTIMTQLEKFKQTKEWSNTQYIPYPSTWLNQKRWEDQIETKEDRDKKLIEELKQWEVENGYRTS